MITFTERPDSELLTWSAPAAGLWVASTPNTYLGMVDRTHDGFVATDCRGHEVGVFAELQEARLAVYEAWCADPSSAVALCSAA